MPKVGKIKITKAAQMLVDGINVVVEKGCPLSEEEIVKMVRAEPCQKADPWTGKIMWLTDCWIGQNPESGEWRIWMWMRSSAQEGSREH